MKTSDFNYHLPEELIANYPLEKRSLSRLLVFQDAISMSLSKIFLNILRKGIY